METGLSIRLTDEERKNRLPENHSNAMLGMWTETFTSTYYSQSAVDDARIEAKLEVLNKIFELILDCKAIQGLDSAILIGEVIPEFVDDERKMLMQQQKGNA